MDKNNNQIHTLKEYKEKYSKERKNLLSFSKKQVEAFDKKYKTEKDYLLKDHKWWLIGDRYYEIPSKASGRGWRNLSGGARFAICALLGVTVAGAAGITTYVVVKNSSGIYIDNKSSGDVEIGQITTTSTTKDIQLIVKNQDKSIYDAYVTIDHVALSSPEEYTYNIYTRTVSIKLETLNNKKGKIVIEPQLVSNIDMIVTCDDSDQHTFNSNDKGKHQIKLYDGKSKKQIVDSIEFHEYPQSIINLDITSGEFTLWENKYGSITLTASAYGYKPITFEMEVASFDKLDTDSLAEGIIKAKDTNITGDVFLPNRYYNAKTKEWVKLTKIEDGAFNGCSNLEKLHLSNNITSIDGAAFAGCPKITFDVERNENFSKNDDGSILFNKDSSSLISCQKGDDVNLTGFNGLKTIKDNAFKNNKVITSVSFPASLGKIAPRAFEGCDNLKTAEFYNNTEGWAQIGGNAITIGTDDKGKQQNAINLCEVGPNTTDNWGYTGISKFEHLVFTRIGTTNTCSVRDSKSETMPANLFIPDKDPDNGYVVAIESNSFTNNKTITSVTIPESVISIGANAFYGTGLNDIMYNGEGTFRVYNKTDNVKYMLDLNEKKDDAIKYLLSNDHAFIKNLITLTPQKAELKVNETVQIASSVVGVTWGSSDYSVATVSETGLVTAQSEGKAYIYVDYDDLCGAIEITVTAE